MDSSAFDLLVVPILWGTLGAIGAGAVLLYVMQAVEAMLKKCSSRATINRASHSDRPMPESSDPIGRMQQART